MTLTSHFEVLGNTLLLVTGRLFYSERALSVLATVFLINVEFIAADDIDVTGWFHSFSVDLGPISALTLVAESAYTAILAGTKISAFFSFAKMIVVIVVVLLRVFIYWDRLDLWINILYCLNFCALSLGWSRSRESCSRIIFLKSLIEYNKILQSMILKNTFLVSDLNLRRTWISRNIWNILIVQNFFISYFLQIDYALSRYNILRLMLLSNSDDPHLAQLINLRHRILHTRVSLLLKIIDTLLIVRHTPISCLYEILLNRLRSSF